MESTVAGRRRNATRHSAEDQALDQIAKEVMAIKYLKYKYYKLNTPDLLTYLIF